MSHFAVMVVTKTQTEEELKAALQPFHEYECTGTMDQYVIFQDCHDEVVEEWNEMTSTAYRSPDGKVYGGSEDIFYREPTAEEQKTVRMGMGFGSGISWASKDWGDGKGYRAKVRFTPTGFEEFQRSIREEYETMEEFAEQYHGYDIIQDGRIGRYTNPNKKWDWWTAGGRWSGFLRLKDGAKVDSAAKRDVDFAGVVAEARENAAKEWDEVHAVVNHRDWLSWKYCRERGADLDAARELYNKQQVVIDLRTQLHLWDVDDFLKSKDEYMDSCGKTAFVTFAILYDGKWFQRGEMGWWTVVYDEDEDWDNVFHEILKDIPGDRFLTIVDCHI